MKLIKKGQGQPYQAEGHFGCWSVRKLSDKDSQYGLGVSLSYFLPEGGATMSSSPRERAYFLLSGSMVVKGKAEEHTVEAGDIIYIGPGEEREMRVAGTEPAAILVVTVAK